MKGLKVIPLFLLFSVLSYFGMRFLEDNEQKIDVQFWGFHTPTLSIGMTIITSILVGMLIVGILYIVFAAPLAWQVRSLKRKLNDLEGYTKRKSDPNSNRLPQPSLGPLPTPKTEAKKTLEPVKRLSAEKRLTPSETLKEETENTKPNTSETKDTKQASNFFKFGQSDSDKDPKNN